jgi:hypothetical protein
MKGQRFIVPGTFPRIPFKNLSNQALTDMQNDTPVRLDQFGSTPFITRTPEGIAVDLSKLESSAQFMTFADRVFTSGYLFANLDYMAFQGLLSDYSFEMQAHSDARGKKKIGTLLFAKEIVVFSATRKALYKSPHLISGAAEYVFEPVMIETTISVPLLADNPDGTQSVVGVEKRSAMVKATLSFDEFVADMWTKGIRFGIDAHLVKDMINNGKTGRLVFANPLPPQDGVDAQLKEQSKNLYRDDSPRKLSNGAIDLRQFKNRFPQIKNGERLLKKIPCQSGEPGMDIKGEIIESPPPEDFDFNALVGEGTRIERTAEGDFIVATMDGFLNIDTSTNRVAVMEKIVNFTGVSIKTTGDIALEGDYFEEHGEIQEKRIVEGKSITVMADVFGRIISSGGAILLTQNLVGGSALNREGSITIQGLASNATLESPHGTISISRAESSVVVGARIEMETAVNCTIVGDDINIKTAAGCVIAGKRIHIETAIPRKVDQTFVSVLLPDLTGLNMKIATFKTQIGDLDKKIEALRKKIETLSEPPEVKNYLIIAGKVQRKEITLTEEQRAHLQKLGARITPTIKSIAAINVDIQALRTEQQTLSGKIEALVQSQKESTGRRYCTIEHPDHGTRIRKLNADTDALLSTPTKELKIRLQEAGRPEDRLELGTEPFTWKAS